MSANERLDLNETFDCIMHGKGLELCKNLIFDVMCVLHLFSIVFDSI